MYCIKKIDIYLNNYVAETPDLINFTINYNNGYFSKNIRILFTV